MLPAISVKYPKTWNVGASIIAGTVVALPYIGLVLLGLFIAGYRWWEWF